MGRKRRRDNPTNDMPSFLNLSASSTSSQNVTLSSLGEKINTLISLVKGNGDKLDSLENKIKSLGDRVTQLEVSNSDFQKRNVESDQRISSIENQKDLLKEQYKIMTDEISNQRSAINQTVCRLAKMEFEKLQSNIIVWNVPTDNQQNATEICTSIITEGLELSPVPRLKVLQVNKLKKFIKVEVADKDEKMRILKCAKKLRGKTIAGFHDIYISDDAPPEIRKMRNDLLRKKIKLREIGIEAWVSKSFPPTLNFNRLNGSLAKYSHEDSIPELDQFARSKLRNNDSSERMRGERSGGRFDAPGEVMAD